MRSDDLPTPDAARWRVLITGSREWADRGAIYDALNFYWDLTGHLTVVHGDCPKGADAMARKWCENLNRGEMGQLVTEERHPAEWDEYGKRAGFIRNAKMVELGADVCLAFIHNNSRGASHTANLAELAGITTVRWRNL